MVIRNRKLLANIGIFLLCCTIMNSYADGPSHRKYDHRKDYFDYYNDKPFYRHEKLHHYRNNPHRNKHRHTRFCKKRRHQPVSHGRLHHGRHHKHRHFDQHNIGRGFVFRIIH